MSYKIKYIGIKMPPGKLKRPNKPTPKPPEIDLLTLWSGLTTLEDAIREMKIKITEWIAQ